MDQHSTAATKNTFTRFKEEIVLSNALIDPNLEDYVTIINIFEEYKEQPCLLDPIVASTVTKLQSLLTDHVTIIMTNLQELIYSFFSHQLQPPDPPQHNQDHQDHHQLEEFFDNEFELILIRLQRICHIFYTLIKVRKLKYILKFVSPHTNFLHPLFSFLLLISSPLIESTLKKLTITNASFHTDDIQQYSILTTSHFYTIPQFFLDKFHSIFNSFQIHLQWHTGYAALVLASTIVLTPFPLHTFDEISSKYTSNQLQRISTSLLSQLRSPTSLPLSLVFFTLSLPIRVYSVLTILLSSPSTIQLPAALTLGRMLSRPDFLARSFSPASDTKIEESNLYPTLKQFCNLASAILTPQNTSSSSPTYQIPIGFNYYASFHTTQHNSLPILDIFPHYACGYFLTMSTLFEQIKIPPPLSPPSSPSSLSSPPSTHPLLSLLISYFAPILIDIPVQFFTPQPTISSSSPSLSILPSSINSTPSESISVSAYPTQLQIQHPSVRQIPGLFGSLLRGLSLETQEQCMQILIIPETNQLPRSLFDPNVVLETKSQNIPILPIWLSNQSIKSLRLWIKTLKRFTLLLLSQHQTLFYISALTTGISFPSTQSTQSTPSTLSTPSAPSAPSTLSTPSTPSAPSTPSPSAPSTPSLFQSIIQLLFHFLSDESWGIRWSAAKGFGLVLQRLSPSYLRKSSPNFVGKSHTFHIHFMEQISTTIVQQLLTLGSRALLQQEGNTLTGVLLSCSELLRFRLIPLSALLSFIKLILLSLWYPIQQTSLNTKNLWAPMLIRECACLSLYTLARGYNFTDFQHMIQQHNTIIHQSNITSAHQISQTIQTTPYTYTTISNLILTIYDALLITCLLDPEKNVRCAASASLQEFIGRYYHSFSTYPHCYTEFLQLQSLSVSVSSQLPVSVLSSQFHNFTPYFKLLSNDPSSCTFQHDIAQLRHYLDLQLHSSHGTVYSSIQLCPEALHSRFQPPTSFQPFPPFLFLPQLDTQQTSSASFYITHFHLSALNMLSDFDLSTEIQLNTPQSLLYPPSQVLSSSLIANILDNEPSKHISDSLETHHQNNPFKLFADKLHILLHSSPHYTIPVLYFIWYRFLPSPQQFSRIFSTYFFSLLCSSQITSQLMQTFLLPPPVSPDFQWISWFQYCFDCISDPSPFILEGKISFLGVFLSTLTHSHRSHTQHDLLPLSIFYQFLAFPTHYLTSLSNADPSTSPSPSPSTTTRNSKLALKLSQQTNWLSLRTQLLSYLSSLVDYIAIIILSQSHQYFFQSSPHYPSRLFESLQFYFNIAISILSNHHTYIQTLAANLCVKIHSLFIHQCSTEFGQLSSPLQPWLDHWIQYTAFRISPALSYFYTKLTSNSNANDDILALFQLSQNNNSNDHQNQGGYLHITDKQPNHRPQLPQFKFQDIPGYTTPLVKTNPNTSPSIPNASNRFNRFKTSSQSLPTSSSSTISLTSTSPTPPTLLLSPPSLSPSVLSPFCALPSLHHVGDILPYHFHDWLIFNGQLAQASQQVDQVATKLIIQISATQHQYPFRSYLLNPIFSDNSNLTSNLNSSAITPQQSPHDSTQISFVYAPYDLQGILRVLIQLLTDSSISFLNSVLMELFPTLILFLSHPSVNNCIITRSLASAALAQFISSENYTSFRYDIKCHVDRLIELATLPTSFLNISHPLPKPILSPPSQLFDIFPPYYIPCLPIQSIQQHDKAPSFVELAIGSMTLNQFDISQPTLSTIPPHHIIFFSLFTMFSTVCDGKNEINYPHLLHLTLLSFMQFQSPYPPLRLLSSRIVIIISQNYHGNNILLKIDPFLVTTFRIINTWINYQSAQPMCSLHNSFEPLLWTSYINPSESSLPIGTNSTLSPTLFEFSKVNYSNDPTISSSQTRTSIIYSKFVLTLVQHLFTTSDHPLSSAFISSFFLYKHAIWVSPLSLLQAASSSFVQNNHNNVLFESLCSTQHQLRPTTSSALIPLSLLFTMHNHHGKLLLPFLNMVILTPLYHLYPFSAALTIPRMQQSNLVSTQLSYYFLHTSYLLSTLCDYIVNSDNVVSTQINQMSQFLAQLTSIMATLVRFISVSKPQLVLALTELLCTLIQCSSVFSSLQQHLSLQPIFVSISQRLDAINTSLQSAIISPSQKTMLERTQLTLSGIVESILTHYSTTLQLLNPTNQIWLEIFHSLPTTQSQSYPQSHLFHALLNDLMLYDTSPNNNKK